MRRRRRFSGDLKAKVALEAFPFAYEIRFRRKRIFAVNQLRITAWAETPKIRDLATSP